MSRLDKPHRPGFLNWLSPFGFAYVVVAVIVSLIVIPYQIRNKQRQEQLVKVTQEKVIDKKLLPKKYTASFVRGIVPYSTDKKNFYLYNSSNTARYFARLNVDYESILKPWRTFFESRQFSVNIVSNLKDAAHGPRSVLILPSSVALSSEEKQALTAFQRNGGNILATWGLGSRDRNGLFQGYEFIQKLFDVTVTREIGLESQEEFLNITGDVPITAGYPAGQRIWLEKRSEKWLGLGGGRQAGLYTNWERISSPEAVTAGIAHGELDTGHQARWVMLGFPETSWGPEPSLLYGILENAMQWLARGVLVSKATWPVPYTSAFLVEMDSEEGFENVDEFGQMMDDIKAPATFYSITAEVRRRPDVLRDLSQHHEIAFHGDSHDSFLWQSESVQSERLDRMQREMTEILGRPIALAGFRAPKEEYDEHTERLLANKNFGHHVVDPNRTDARVPFLYQSGISKEPASLVILPRTQRDDFNLPYVEKGKAAEKVLLDALTNDFDMVRHMGALGLLSVHSQHFSGSIGSMVAVMPRFLQYANQHRDQIWITSGNHIAQWWRDRERFKYSTDGLSDKFTISVTISGEKPLEKGAIILTNIQSRSVTDIRLIAPSDRQVIVKPIDQLRSAIVLDGFLPGTYIFDVASRQSKY